MHSLAGAGAEPVESEEELPSTVGVDLPHAAGAGPPTSVVVEPVDEDEDEEEPADRVPEELPKMKGEVRDVEAKLKSGVGRALGPLGGAVCSTLAGMAVSGPSFWTEVLDE